MQPMTDARSPATTPGVARLPNLKALTSARFFAALHVALFHMVRPFSLWGPLATVIGAGYLGVSFFFVLSGFILTYSHAAEYESGRGDAVKFWVARFARVYPVYFVCTALSAYVYRAQLASALHWMALGADFLLVQTWSIRLSNFFNVPAWSLSVEAFFYLVFPFVFLGLRPKTLRWAIVLVVGLWALAMVYPAIVVSRPYDGDQVFQARRLPLLALPEFLAGIALGWLHLRYRPSEKVAGALAAAGLALLVGALALADHFPELMLHNGLLLPVYGMLILGLAQNNVFSRVLSHPALILLGEASFALYLTHFMFNDWMRVDFWRAADDWGRFVEARDSDSGVDPAALVRGTAGAACDSAALAETAPGGAYREVRVRRASRATWGSGRCRRSWVWS